MLKLTTYILLLTAFLSVSLTAQQNQVSIPRIDLMPDQPTPYVMRDWKQVAINYDRFVFDESKTGLYLPLIGFRSQGNNYPERPTFGLHTYVGTKNPNGFEAINVLPSLVGASLVDLDKSAQNGKNYVLMAQDYFNKKNGQNLYLNGTSSKSGNDWWYDMMPNVFFYQLYDLYPAMGGEADFQFNSIADRMLEAVRAMGGSDVPWEKPNMNYRAWNFETMQPLAAGVPEPEAAGAFSWLLYMAYTKSGNHEYLKGAEWSMEFLNGLNGNPSYELQLPYGTYAAARMNAEIGTHYDVEKMVNWSFDKGSLRGWGTIVDKWSGIDVSGLVGESESSTDYAFQLNGVQQAAALVPVVRYDKRFAKAIAKWVLNLANANRLFYPGYLPSALQDASDWSSAHDPNRVIGYEAMRENFQGLSPYATGDAVRGGWANTNLALYGTSSIGYLGAMVEITNKEKVLKIDLLKTDFFHQKAYPSYLMYNPFNEEVVISLQTGSGNYDIYDPLSETFIIREASGPTNITIPAKTAVMAVVCPAGGKVSFDQNKMLVDGVVVDFDQHQMAYTRSPRIKALGSETLTWEVNKNYSIYATLDEETDTTGLTWTWETNGQKIEGFEDQLTYGFASLGEKEILLIVKNNSGLSDTASLQVNVVAQINLPPVIYNIEKSVAFGQPGQTISLMCEASEDLDGVLTYEWTVSGGTIQANGKDATWTLPASKGIFEVTVKATDSLGLFATKSEFLLVDEFTGSKGKMIAYYPLDGNGQDFSGNGLHGTIVGATSATNADGEANKAYFFNGNTNHMSVPNSALLNFENGITVSGWFRLDRKFDRESFIISHGSWQNRWKVSIIPEQKLRWTIKTLTGVKDLDSKEALEINRFYHMAVTYDKTNMLVFLDGKLVSFAAHNGNLAKTGLALYLGQSLPDQQDYNFRGILDEYMIFDYALSPDQIQQIFETGMLTSTTGGLHIADLGMAYPNPTNGILNLPRTLLDKIDEVSIYDSSGQKIMTKKARQISGEIDLSQQSAGVYWMQVLAHDKRLFTQKIIKF